MSVYGGIRRRKEVVICGVLLNVVIDFESEKRVVWGWVG